jgi:F0F1-type ATP synthase delta subunit
MKEKLSNKEKFKMIWETVKEEDRQKFVISIFEKQPQETQEAMLEYLATVGTDRILANIKKKKDETKPNSENFS